MSAIAISASDLELAVGVRERQPRVYSVRTAQQVMPAALRGLDARGRVLDRETVTGVDAERVGR